MLHEWMALRPGGLTDGPPALALAITATGLGCWLIGGRFSRSILTLALVAVGAWVGVRMPRWFGWEIDGMGLGMAGAMLLGFGGYLLHRTWAGLLLGALLATSAGAAAWIALAPGVSWMLPPLDWTWNVPEVLRQVWQSLPPEMAKVIPLTTVGGVMAGIVTALRWPKLSRVLAFDLLGVLLMVTVGVPVVAAYQPQWIKYLPAGTERQVFTVMGLVLVGLAVQWKLTPATPRKAAIPASALRSASPVLVPDSPARGHVSTSGASAAPRRAPRRFAQLQEVLA
jgi:hypothetical protein